MDAVHTGYIHFTERKVFFYGRKKELRIQHLRSDRPQRGGHKLADARFTVFSKDADLESLSEG
jgi:hypothetical protein